MLSVDRQTVERMDGQMDGQRDATLSPYFAKATWSIISKKVKAWVLW